jgi:hypothetical protein
MIDLIIGPSLSNNPSTNHVEDIFEGISLFESKKFNLIVFNLTDCKLNERDLSRLKKLVLSRKTNCIFISNQKEILNFDEIEFVQSFVPEHIDLYIDDSIKELQRRRDLTTKYLEQSKQKRSIPFYLLGILLLSEPLLKVLFLKIDTGFGFGKVFEVVTSIEDPLKFLEFWALFPLAGLALLRPAAISLFVFATVQLYSVYSYLNYEKFTWPFVQENPHISSALLLCLNLGILAFFLIPENRKPYLFKTKELFRKNKRIDCSLNGTAKFDGGVLEVEVLNLSETGLMASTKKKIGHGEKIIICIEQYKFYGEIVRVSKAGDFYQYGILFKGRNPEAVKLIKKLEQGQTINSVA